FGLHDHGAHLSFRRQQPLGPLSSSPDLHLRPQVDADVGRVPSVAHARRPRRHAAAPAAPRPYRSLWTARGVGGSVSFLSEEQRRFFDANGYLVIPGALPAAELAAVRTAADEAEARWRADPTLPGTRIPEFVEIPAIMEYHPLLFDLVEHPAVFPLI